MELPLSGVRVVDFTANMSGPYCTQALGDMGADVVKVESPAGDVLRQVGQGRGGMGAYFANLNRSKRSIVVDLTDERTRPTVQRLVDTADVVVHNMRRSAARRLGIDGPQLRAGRPALVHLTITGYGDEGPFADRPVYDHQIQALSGIAAMQGLGGGAHADLVRHGIVDKLTGQVAAHAVTAALLARERTGAGAELAVSMLEVAIAFLWPDGMMDHTIMGEPDTRFPSTARTFRLTPTSDGFVAMMLITKRQWSGLFAALGIAGEPGLYATVAGGATYGGEMMREVRAKLGAMTTDEVVDLLSRNDVPCSPVLDPGEVADHPQVQALGLVGDVDHPVMGRLRQPRPVPHFGARLADLAPAPALGAHTDEVLAELHGEGEPEIS